MGRQCGLASECVSAIRFSEEDIVVVEVVEA